MTELTDHELLAEFARTGSEAAFATLTARHVNLVYSTALRFSGNPHHAEEITQAVFIILARKAEKLSPRSVLSGWLYQAARLTAANFVKGEMRRQHREQEAYMQSTVNETDPAAWAQIAPLLDEAMGHLGETDRNAVVLRFFENQTAAEVAAALKLTEAAAHKRVNRALEKLRKIFTKRGVALSATLIAGAVSVGSVQAAPAGLAATISTVAIAKGAAAGGSTLALVKGVLKLMTWTKAKMAVAVGASMLLAVGTTAVVIGKITQPKLVWTNPAWADDPQYWSADPRVLGKNPRVLIMRPTRFSNDDSVINAYGETSATGPNRFMAKNAPLSKTLFMLYNARESRMVLSSDVPAGHFDFMLTLAKQPKQAREIYEKMLKETFGLAAHRETRDVDVLALKVVKPPSSGLQAASGGRFSQTFGKREIRMSHTYWARFCGEIEQRLGIPVIDKTDLAWKGQFYDFRIQWQPQPNESDDSAFKRALRDQLGLELTPGREPVEMLVVEKVK